MKKFLLTITAAGLIYLAWRRRQEAKEAGAAAWAEGTDRL